MRAKYMHDVKKRKDESFDGYCHEDGERPCVHDAGREKGGVGKGKESLLLPLAQVRRNIAAL